MTKHEEKRCPRCNACFECKVGNVTECQCYGITLTAEQENFITANYKDCLCRNCLLDIQQHNLPAIHLHLHKLNNNAI
jgi:hypothetical protein